MTGMNINPVKLLYKTNFQEFEEWWWNFKILPEITKNSQNHKHVAESIRIYDLHSSQTYYNWLSLCGLWIFKIKNLNRAGLGFYGSNEVGWYAIFSEDPDTEGCGVVGFFHHNNNDSFPMFSLRPATLQNVRGSHYLPGNIEAILKIIHQRSKNLFCLFHDMLIFSRPSVTQSTWSFKYVHPMYDD